MEGSGNEKFNSDELREAGGEDEDEETKATIRREEMRRRQDELTKRGEGKDFLSRLLVERNEAEQEEILLRAQEARELRSLQTRQTQRLGEELLRIKNEDTREQKRRQLLRKDSIELRRLEDKLRTAYAAKDVRLQLAQRELRRENEKIREMEEARMIQGWYQNDSFERQQMLEARRKKEEYRRDLQDQLVSNHRLRQRNAEETRRERKLVEEVSEVLRTEDLENQRRKRETASRLLAEERSFVEARELWKFKEKQVLLKEHEDYIRILADKMVERKQNDDAKAVALAAKEAMLEKMRKKILDDESRKREREDAVIESIACEQKIDLENRSRKAALEKSLTAKGLLDDATRQKIAMEERKAKEAEVERAFAEYLEEERQKSIIEDKRKVDERRARGIEYAKALKEAIVNNSIRYTDEILENQAELKLNRKLDAARRIFIEEERSRILREHAPRLHGFLKPGVLFKPEAEISTNKTPSSCNYKESFENPRKF